MANYDKPLLKNESRIYISKVEYVLNNSKILISKKENLQPWRDKGQGFFFSWIFKHSNWFLNHWLKYLVLLALKYIR